MQLWLVVFFALWELIACFSRISLQSCCRYGVGDGVDNDIISCVNESSAYRWNIAPQNIVVLTSHTAEISNYSAYSTFAKEAYCAYNNYKFIVADGNISSYEPRDPRWNKVKILSSAIDQNRGFANYSDYVIWLDADLIMLNFSFRFEEVIEAYPDAHVIISHDADNSKAMMDSGALIVKNSKFSRQFLDKWWGYDSDDLKDHENHHKKLVSKYYFEHGDQSQLDAVYKWYQKQEQKASQNSKKKKKKSSYSKGDINKIAILPSNAFNSKSPACLYQQDSDRVLHLSDEISSLRRLSFQVS